MTLTININDIDNVENVLEEQARVISDYLDANMEFLVNSYVIPEVRAVAMSSNVPSGFVVGIKFIKTGYLAGEVINTWGTKALPLALWFNYGTRDHGSKGDWPMHWKDKNGKDVYAMWVRGVPKTLVMEIGIEIGKKKLKQAVPKFIEDNLS